MHYGATSRKGEAVKQKAELIREVFLYKEPEVDYNMSEDRTGVFLMKGIILYTSKCFLQRQSPV